ncbi:MAG: TRAP transporter substrate-binding protein, partial [Acidimicrobiales bacterium]
LVLAFVLVAAACGSDDSTDTADGDSADTETGESADADDDADAEADEPADDAADDLGEMGDSVNIVFAFGFPEGHPVYQNALIPWAEEVSAATDGTVTMEFFPGGALGPPPGTYEQVVSRVQDAGWSLPGYTAGRFPITTVVELPFTFESAAQATDVMWTLYEEFPEFQEEYSDTKVLALFTHDLGQLWSSTGEVSSMDDVGGLSLRSPGALQNKLIEELGGTPVNMPVGELFDSLDRGVVDGTVIAASGVRDFGLAPLVTSGILCDCYVAAFFVNMNLDTWNSLSPAQQAAVDSVSLRSLSIAGAEAFDAANEASFELVESEGIQLTELTGEELDRWIEAGNTVAENWISDGEAEGLPAQAMYDRMQELVG